MPSELMRVRTPRETWFVRGIVLKLDPFDRGYCLGLIVGEGCFTGDRKKPVLAVRLHEDDPEPLYALQRAFGGHIYGPYNFDGRRSRVWMLCGLDLEAAVPFFFEYLPPSKKREQFERWLDRWWWEMARSKRRHPDRRRRRSAKYI